MATERAAHGQVVHLASFLPKGAGVRSRALVKHRDFEVLCIDLPAGASLPAHEVGGPITVQCLRGDLSLSVDGEPRGMSAGAWVFLDGGTAHAVEAVRDASLLVTILFTEEARSAARGHASSRSAASQPSTPPTNSQRASRGTWS